MEELYDVVFVALVSVLAAGVPVIVSRIWRLANGALARFEEQIGGEKFEQLREWAETLIRAAEQKAGLETNEQKYDYVFNLLRERAVELGVPLSLNQLDALLEGVLSWIKSSSSIELELD